MYTSELSFSRTWKSSLWNANTKEHSTSTLQLLCQSSSLTLLGTLVWLQNYLLLSRLLFFRVKPRSTNRWPRTFTPTPHLNNKHFFTLAELRLSSGVSCGNGHEQSLHCRFNFVRCNFHFNKCYWICYSTASGYSKVSSLVSWRIFKYKKKKTSQTGYYFINSKLAWVFGWKIQEEKESPFFGSCLLHEHFNNPIIGWFEMSKLI